MIIKPGIFSQQGGLALLFESSAAQIDTSSLYNFKTIDARTFAAAPGDATNAQKLLFNGTWTNFNQVAGVSAIHFANMQGWPLSGFFLDHHTGYFPGGLKVYSSSDPSKIFNDQSYDANWTLRATVASGDVADQFTVNFTESQDVAWALVSQGQALSTHWGLAQVRPVGRAIDLTTMGHSLIDLAANATITVPAVTTDATANLTDGLYNTWFMQTNPTTIVNGWIIFDFGVGNLCEISSVIVADQGVATKSPQGMRLVYTEDDLDDESGTFASWLEPTLANAGYDCFYAEMGGYPAQQNVTFPHTWNQMYPTERIVGRKFAVQLTAQVNDWLQLSEVFMQGRAL